MGAREQRESMGPDMGSRTGTGYIWLAYSVFFFIEPILRHNSRYWVKCGVIYVIFLGIYIANLHARTMRQHHIYLAAFYLLAVLTIPINGSASTFFVYSAAFLPFVVASIPRTIAIMAAQALGLVLEGWLLHLNPINIAIAIILIAVVGTTNIFVAQQKRANYKLNMAHNEIEQLAALAERERIARDLHDVLGHTLSVIVLKAELAGKLMERDPERAAQEIADVEKTARTALAEVREAIGGYRSRGLPAEMESARSTLAAAGVALACESPLPALEAAQETVICLAVREAVTNIVRHAHATHCRMKFATTRDDYCSLAIDDDGTHAILQEGNGLRGMRERVEAMGGRFAIDTTLGTRLLIELPNNAVITGTAKASCVAL
jgi:two-component system sensor histidine kinase DesK